MTPEETEDLAKESVRFLFAASEDLLPKTLKEVKDHLSEGGWDKEMATAFVAAMDLINSRSMLVSMKVKQAFAL